MPTTTYDGDPAARFGTVFNSPLCGYSTETPSDTAHFNLTTTPRETLYRRDDGATAFPDGWRPSDGCPSTRRGATLDAGEVVQDLRRRTAVVGLLLAAAILLSQKHLLGL